MAQQDPVNQDTDSNNKPAYLGKTTAVLHYCLATGFGAAALALGWQAIRAHYHGTSNSFSTSLDQTIFLGFLSVYCLVFAITFFLMPTLQSQFPKLRHENRFSHENMEAQHKKSARYSKKHRKVVVQHAPKSIRRAIRFCTWIPRIAFVLLLGSALISISPISPNWLSKNQSAFAALFSGRYQTLILFFGFFIVFHVPELLLERHARHLYDRHLRRLESDAGHCPECDYPIDREQQPEQCPECGIEYPM